MNPALRGEWQTTAASERDDFHRIGVWIDQFVAEWEADHTLTAAAFSGRHVEIAGDTRLLAILGYEELLQREAAGEPVDEDAFCAEMCDSEEGLRNLIEVHNFVSWHPRFLPDLPALPPEFSVNVPASLHRAWPTLGETLAGFKLLQPLGRGAFARVYLAEELALGRRRVAVKVSPGGAKEAHFLGKLRHPNIVPVFSIQLEPARNLTLICMPFLGRVTLRDVLRELFRDGRRPRRAYDLAKAIAQTARSLEGMAANSTAGEAADGDVPPVSSIDARPTKGSYVDAVIHLAEQLADALVYTNGQGIYHRDLKPSNVLLDSRGTPMLLDFNVSFDKRAASQRWGGTLQYMAPELVRVVAEDAHEVLVDPRSDLFSLAVMLYELLSGAPPFGHQPGGAVTAEAARDLYTRQQTLPLRLCDRNPDVEPALSALIGRCLSFDVKERPRTADELLYSLRRLAGRRGRLGRWAWRRRGALVAATLALGVAAAAGGHTLATLPSYAERQFLAAEDARQRGDYANALAHLDAAENHGLETGRIGPARSNVHYQLAKQAFLTDDFRVARDHCNDALNADEFAWKAHLLRARTQIHLHDIPAAAQDVACVEQLHMTSEVHAVRGDLNCATSQWGRAVAAYRRALDEGVTAAAIYNNLAYALARLGHREQALETLDDAISLDGGLGDAYYQRGFLAAALASDNNRPVPQRSMTDVETAISLLSDNYRVYYSAAHIFAAFAAQTEAAEHRQKAATYLLESLRLGLQVTELPSAGPLAPMVQAIKGSPEYEAALTAGAEAVRSRPPGLVDSLQAFPLD